MVEVFVYIVKDSIHIHIIDSEQKSFKSHLSQIGVDIFIESSRWVAPVEIFFVVFKYNSMKTWKV